MRMDKCIRVRMDMRIDTCIDMCIDMRVDMCIDIYVNISMDMCVDMCIEGCECDVDVGRAIVSQRRLYILDGRDYRHLYADVLHTRFEKLVEIASDMATDDRVNMRLEVCIMTDM